jgi:hypothetical protein
MATHRCPPDKISSGNGPGSLRVASEEDIASSLERLNELQFRSLGSSARLEKLHWRCSGETLIASATQNVIADMRLNAAMWPQVLSSNFSLVTPEKLICIKLVVHFGFTSVLAAGGIVSVSLIRLAKSLRHSGSIKLSDILKKVR